MCMQGLCECEGECLEFKHVFSSQTPCTQRLLCLVCVAHSLHMTAGTRILCHSCLRRYLNRDKKNGAPPPPPPPPLPQQQQQQPPAVARGISISIVSGGGGNSGSSSTTMASRTQPPRKEFYISAIEKLLDHHFLIQANNTDPSKAIDLFRGTRFYATVYAICRGFAAMCLSPSLAAALKKKDHPVSRAV